MLTRPHDNWRKNTPAIVLLDDSRDARWRRRWILVVRGGVLFYLLLVLAVWLLLRFAGEQWWPATMMLFGPRWIYGLPLLLLVPGAAVLRPRLLWPLAVALIVVIGPIMGFRIPWGRAFAREGPTVRVLTCNVDGKATPKAIRDLIDATHPDIVALQECNAMVIPWPDGWHAQQQGELLVASRFPVQLVQEMEDFQTGHVWPRAVFMRCKVTMPDREVDFCCVHLSSPRYGIANLLDRSTLVAPSRSGVMSKVTNERRQQSEKIAALLRNDAASVILVGDFNTPADSVFYRQYWADYRNAFSVAGFGFGATMRPCVRGCRFGIRIDHILTGTDWRPRACWVGRDVGSEHLPLIADLVWAPDPP